MHNPATVSLDKLTRVCAIIGQPVTVADGRAFFHAAPDVEGSLSLRGVPVAKDHGPMGWGLYVNVA